MRTVPSFVMFGVAGVDADFDQLIYALSDDLHGLKGPALSVAFTFH